MTRGAVTVALAALGLAACTVENQVLNDPSVITTCDQVWARGLPGDPCDLAGQQCYRDNPDDPTCWSDFAYCVDDALVFGILPEPGCDECTEPGCTECMDDTSCGFGEATCAGQQCEACPPPDPDGADCAPCPPGWIDLTRNGCPTCECAPPSQCNLLAPDTCAPEDPTGSQCYRSQRVGDHSCVPSDPGCFVDVCAAVGCTPDPPVGCLAVCRAEMDPCGLCATQSCACDQATGAWVCDQICIDEFPLALDCIYEGP